MSEAAGHDKHMPCRMEIAQAVEREEYDSEGVCDSTGSEPENAMEADGVKERASREDYKPSLKQVDEGGRNGKAFDGEAFEEHTSDGE